MSTVNATESKVMTDTNDTASIPAFWVKLTAALAAQGATFTQSAHGSIQLVLGECVAVRVHTEMHRFGRHTPTGKLYANTGYGSGQTFKQSKARGGDFDYAALAENLIAQANDTKAGRERDARDTQRHADAVALRAKLLAEFGHETLPYGGQGYMVRLSADRGEGLCLKIHGAITEDQMRALLATCKAVGLLPEKASRTGP